MKVCRSKRSTPEDCREEAGKRRLKHPNSHDKGGTGGGGAMESKDERPVMASLLICRDFPTREKKKADLQKSA